MTRHFIASALLCIATLTANHAAEPPKPRHGEKLLIINDDGFSNFYSGRYKTADDLRRQAALFKDTQVAVLEWCITSGSRVNFPCKTVELVGTGVKDFGRRGDQLATETLHRLAIRVY